jgi:hypothetical protein
MSTPRREPMLPLAIPTATRLPSHRIQEDRWAQLDARRPHAIHLTPQERAEFDRLDTARLQRMARKGLI